MLFRSGCAERGFHPKFFQFEPQYISQKALQIKRVELFGKLEQIGCSFQEDAPRHDNLDVYEPTVTFEYVSTKGKVSGVHVTLGCGKKSACEACSDYLCIFVKPSEKGLHIKPCTVSDKIIDLTSAIRNEDLAKLLDLIDSSRQYLKTAPGMGTSGWNKEEHYNPSLKSSH